MIDPTHRRPIYADTLAMFSKKRNAIDRESGGCETPLAHIYGVDFEVVTVSYELDGYFQELFKTLTEEQCQHVVRTCNNVIVEIRIKLAVIKAT